MSFHCASLGTPAVTKVGTLKVPASGGGYDFLLHQQVAIFGRVGVDQRHRLFDRRQETADGSRRAGR